MAHRPDPMPDGLRDYCFEYVACVAEGRDLPAPPAHFAHDGRAWWMCQWAMIRFTAYMLREVGGAAPRGDGSWGMEIEAIATGATVAPEDAPPEVALVGRFLTCALNEDMVTAAALAFAHDVDDVHNACSVIAHTCRELAIELEGQDEDGTDA